jgi:hypothetical protein
MYTMTRRLHVLNARLLLALIIASLGMAGIVGEVAAQTDDSEAPVVAASPVDGGGEGDDSAAEVAALPETGQGSAASAEEGPILLLVAVAGVVGVAGVMLYRTRRA